jgi:hypothetical protein
MLFNPKLFDAVWLAIACTAVAVGLAVAATAVVSIVTAIQALRGKTERRSLIVEAYLRQSQGLASSDGRFTNSQSPWDS